MTMNNTSASPVPGRPKAGETPSGGGLRYFAGRG
jgi:hypothetical protein